MIISSKKQFITIRAVRQTDFGKLAQVYVRAYNAAQVGENWDVSSAKEFLDYLHRRQPDLFFVAATGSGVVGGIAAGIKPWWDGAHMYDGEIFVDPKYQGKNVARLLFTKLLGTGIKKRSVKIFESTTFSDRKFPFSWYKKLGIRRVKNWMVISGRARDILRALKHKKV